MSNTIQLYIDENREKKGYPITSPDRVIDENGINVAEHLKSPMQINIQCTENDNMKVGFEAIAIDMTKTNIRTTAGLLLDGNIDGGGFKTGIIVRNSNEGYKYNYNEGILISDYNQCGIRIVGDCNAIVLDTLTDDYPDDYMFTIRNTTKGSNFSITKAGTVIASDLILTNNERTLVVPAPANSSTGATAGALKRVGNELYFHNGSGWKKVQLV